MTVIAWDGVKSKQFATDSMVSTGINEHMQSRKMNLIQHPATKKNDFIVAGAGQLKDIVKLMLWWEDQEGYSFPFANDDRYSQLIVVDLPKNQIVEFNNHPSFAQNTVYELDGQYAWGSGSQVALAAMMAGSDAIKAVETAIAICPGCGGAIQYCDTTSNERKIELLEASITYKKVDHLKFDIKVW